MKCPNCNETLLISERHQVEIDYCPNCRGIWLDRGELDKIIGYIEGGQDKGFVNTAQSTSQWSDRNDNAHYYDRRYQNRPHKKKSFLGDLFDFD